MTRIVALPQTPPAQTTAPRKPRPAQATHIQVENVSHHYGRHSLVLEDVSLSIEPGEVVALIGRSGCGKSTLLHIMAGMLHPSQGTVYANGNPVRHADPSRVMMFQDPSLYPWMTVAQNAGIGLRFGGRPELIATRVPQLLELVGLEDFAGRNAQELSGGQAQRVALARSLATEPGLLLLDEPFSALDAFARRALRRDLRDIARACGLTVVLVTHDVAEAVAMADRAVILRPNPGRIAHITEIAPEIDRVPEAASFRAEEARLTALYAEHAA